MQEQRASIDAWNQYMVVQLSTELLLQVVLVC